MEIIIKNNHRILIKNDITEVSINDKDIVQYTGVYHKIINDIVKNIEINTTFIGIVETCRSRCDTGITGIYIKPFYIWDIINSEWLKIVNLNPPKQKYFLYPYLLMLLNISYILILEIVHFFWILVLTNL